MAIKKLRSKLFILCCWAQNILETQFSIFSNLESQYKLKLNNLSLETLANKYLDFNILSKIN